MRFFPSGRRFFSALAAAGALLAGAASALLGVCGPFNDVTDAQFCPFVLEIFTLGITTGTTPTTYDPAASVSRLQMAAFLSRSVDGVLRRGGRRAAMDHFWTTGASASLGLTTVGSAPQLVRCDGLDVWVANTNSGSVSRVRASDGGLLQTWTGMTVPFGVLSAMGRIFVNSNDSPGSPLYRIDPSQPVGVVTTVATLGDISEGITFDGVRIWTADTGSGRVSIVTPGPTVPWTVTAVTAGFNGPGGILYDGSNVWVSDTFAGTLLKLNSAGAILQTVTVGASPKFPAFDGANIWVPNFSDASVTVVRASNGAVLATLTGNGISGPNSVAFDGQRILVTANIGQAVSLWKAADLTPLGFFPTGASTNPYGAASDGVDFWISLAGTGKLARF